MRVFLILVSVVLAIFERAGAYHRSGNEAQAMVDAKKACELGVQPACAIASR
jgi:hypothetical protein